MYAGPRVEWIERMRTVTVPKVAAELGAEPIVRYGRQSFPCPACNAPKRHTRTGDRRGAVGVRADGLGWHCFQCDTSGDTLDFVAWHRCGGRFSELADHHKANVREWCSRWLGLDGPPLPAAAPRPKPLEPPPPDYPPGDEIAGLWDACVRADAHPDVSRWLAERRIDAVAVADRDLARALPLGCRAGDLPAWAVTWAASHLLVVQLVDAGGMVRSMLGRAVVPTWRPKSLAASGYPRGGLVLADGLGRQVLAKGQRPEWWPGDLRLPFEICEGEKKWLIRSTLRGDAAEHAPCVIGVESGSWTPDRPGMAARIPDGSRVFVATDPDDQGAKYATAILRTLRTRIVSGAVAVELHPGLELVPDSKILTVRVRTAHAT